MYGLAVNHAFNSDCDSLLTVFFFHSEEPLRSMDRAVGIRCL